MGVAGATGRRGRGSARETLGLVAALSCGLLWPTAMGVALGERVVEVVVFFIEVEVVVFVVFGVFL